MNTPRFDKVVFEAQKLTDKQRVLAKWPDAVFDLASHKCYIFIRGNKSDRIIGQGATESAAWADAARRLENGAVTAKIPEGM